MLKILSEIHSPATRGFSALHSLSTNQRLIPFGFWHGFPADLGKIEGKLRKMG
jgi:hypothetical protein